MYLFWQQETHDRHDTDRSVALNMGRRQMMAVVGNRLHQTVDTHPSITVGLAHAELCLH